MKAHKKAVIISIGTGGTDPHKREINIKNQLGGIDKIINDELPDKLYFVVTDESKETISDYLNKIKNEIEYEIVNLGDHGDDIEYILKKLMSYSDNIKCKFKSISVYATFGTKSMTIALSLYSFIENFTLKILVGARKNGYVITGSERPLQFNPYLIWGKLKIKEIEVLFNKRHFETAIDILEKYQNIFELKSPLLNDEEININDLINIIKFYRYLDSFDFKNMLEIRDNFKYPHSLLKNINYYSEIANYAINMKKVKNKNEKLKYMKEIMKELYRNVKRRISEGRYEDAMARLYRILEFMVQIKLYENYDIVISESIDELSTLIDIKSRYDIDLSEFEKFADDRDGKIRIGLKNGILLLNKLLREEGKNIFINDKDERFIKIMSLRNNSILAHGFNPVGRNTVEDAMNMVGNLIKDKFPELGNIHAIDIPDIKLDL